MNSCHIGRSKFVLVSLIVFIHLCTGVVLTKAQESVEIFGYFESTYMGSAINNEFYQLNTNKLRVDLKSDISEYVSFAANFDYIDYNGKTNWNILDFLSEDISSTVPEEMKGFYTIPFTNRNFLDNAYLKIAFDKFDLTVGKQQISLGTGYVWNPLDIFNVKDPLDPTYEQPGHNAARIDLPIGTDYTLSALYSTGENWEKSGKLLRFKGRVSRFDISLLAIETEWLFLDYTRLDSLNMSFIEYPQRRRLVGMSTAGEILGIGTWAEYAYNAMDNWKDFYELVIGGDYTFDSQTYIMIEFYRNMLGKNNYKQYNLNDWMRQFTSEQKAISRDQIYTLVQHPVTDFLTLGSSFIYSVSDNSLAIVPTLTYSFFENMDIMAYLNANIGQEGTAYSEQSGNGGIIRARVYF